jgi:hypothetical protein
MLPKFTMAIWVVGVVLWGFFWLFFVDLPLKQVGFWLGVLAAWGGAIFQISAAYHARVSHFLECFSRCNEVYAKLNGRLRKPSHPIQVSSDTDMNDAPGDAVIDYFNLCAQEYLMHKMGVIPRFVRDVWHAGIHERACEDDLKAAWEHEVNAGRREGVAADSLYYGFDLRKIMREHHEVNAGKCKKSRNCPWGDEFAKNRSQ